MDTMTFSKHRQGDARVLNQERPSSMRALSVIY
jgi:hypothetical protein